MNEIYISIVVLEKSSVLENKLLSFNIPLDPTRAWEYRLLIDKWLESFPNPDDINSSQIIESLVDPATLAAEIPSSLRGRDPFIFGLQEDPDVKQESVTVVDRPFDWAHDGS